MATTLEAVIGAVYKDGSYEAAENVMNSLGLNLKHQNYSDEEREYLKKYYKKAYRELYQVDKQRNPAREKF